MAQTHLSRSQSTLLGVLGDVIEISLRITYVHAVFYRRIPLGGFVLGIAKVWRWHPSSRHRVRSMNSSCFVWMTILQ